MSRCVSRTLWTDGRCGCGQARTHGVRMTLAASLPEGRPVVWERKTRAEELRLQLADRDRPRRAFPGAPTKRNHAGGPVSCFADTGTRSDPFAGGERTDGVRAHHAAVVAQQVRSARGMFEAMAELEALCSGFAAVRDDRRRATPCTYELRR